METIPRDSCLPEIESELTRPLLQNGSLVQKPLSNRSRAHRSWIWLDERISCHEPARTLLRWFARELIRLPQRPDVDWVSQLKAELELRSKRERIASAERQRLRVCAFVLLDLAAHGWSIRVTRRRIQVCAPGNGNSLEDEKGRVRAAHLIERDAQLAHPATDRFIRQMERRRLTPNGWKSIFSLMRDGRELADQLFRLRALAANDVDAAVAASKACIDPYVQVVRSKEVDRFTGLELMDIWRYFRHTWAMAYQTTPGRKLFVLIRDRSALNHPVIGIGALGSAIVQMSDRDKWIGWDSETFVTALRAQPTREWAIWLSESLK